MTLATTVGPQSNMAPGAAPDAFLSVCNIHSYYGESYIVQGVSFDVMEGEIVALLGRNGAGKTSTLRSIARTAEPAVRQGEIWLNGKPLHKMVWYQAAQLGVSLVPEDRRIIGGDGGGESDLGADRRTQGLATGANLRAFPASRGTPPAGGDHHVGWRAADAGGRPRARTRHQATAGRRTL